MDNSEEYKKALAAVKRLKEEAKELGLLRVRKVRELLLKLARRPMNRRLKADFDEILRFYRRLRKEPFYPPPWPCDGLGHGRIDMGRILNGLGGYFTLEFNDFFRRVFVTGIIGSGKTFLIYGILSCLVPMLRELNACIVILDPNRDFVGLLKKFPEDVWVIRQEKDRDATFEPPPGVALHSWVKTIVAAWGEYLWLQEPSKAKLEDAVMQASTRVSDRAVTLVDAKSQMEATNYRANSPRQRYKETAEDRLQNVIGSVGPTVARCCKSFPLEKLIAPGRVLVYPLPHGKEDRSLNATQKILKIFEWKREMAPVTGTNVILVVDEAFLVFPRNLGQGMTGVPMLVEFLNQARRFGIGLIAATQHPHETLPHLINSGITTSFMLQDQHSRAAILNAMGVANFAGQEFPNLKPRQVLVYCQQWPRPFITTCKDMEWDYEVTDEEIDATMDLILDGLGGRLLDEGEAIGDIPEEAAPEDKGKVPGPYVALGSDAERVLKDMADPSHWMESVTERFTRLRIGNTKQGDVMEELDKRHQLIEIAVVVTGTGRPKKITIPSKRGYEMALGQGWRPMDIPGKGSLEHKWYQHKLCQHFSREGKKAQVEGWVRTRDGKKKNVDVLVWGEEGCFTSVEVACSPDHEVVNALAVFDNGSVKEHIIVCRDTKVRNKVNRKVGNNRELRILRDRGVVKVTTVSDCLSGKGKSEE